MVIAEALAERKDIGKRVEELTELAGRAAVRDSDASDTAEEYDRHAAELLVALNDWQDLTQRINDANNRTKVFGLDGDEMTIAAAIVYRNRLKMEYAAQKSILDAADTSLGRPSSKGRRFWGEGSLRSKDDIPRVAVADLDALRDEINRTAKRIRLLDIEIQKVNWTAEL